jgi:hypothetical protein
VRNGGVWKDIYRERWVKNGWEAINAVKKRGKTRFFLLDHCQKRVWLTTDHGIDVFRNIQSGIHL